MRIVIRPNLAPEREIDLIDRFISVIADELWRACGGNEQLNWLEAERALERLIGLRGGALPELRVERPAPREAGNRPGPPERRGPGHSRHRKGIKGRAQDRRALGGVRVPAARKARR